MSNILENRPFAGNWSQDILNKHRKVVSWTPDAIVLFNGDTKIAGCNECKNMIDFQAFITSVGTNAGVTSGDMTASIEMSIPGHYGDSIFKDGEFIFSTGVEVNVYYRGFFEISGLSQGTVKIVNQDGADTADLSKVEMRPYYPVFHGVVTSVSYSFSGGFYSASLSCNSLLHFWQNQKVNTNAAYLAAGPSESRGSVRLDGHVYTDMTPHQIIFDLFRDSGGSMDGLEWVFSSSGNQKAKSALGGSQYAQTLRYWENRFAAGLYGLRMYGASGAMLSQMQTAFLGDPSRKKGKGKEIKTLIKGQHNITASEKTVKGGLLNLARILGLVRKDSSGKMVNALDVQFQQEVSDKAGGSVGILSTELKAFITDIGALGSVELFQTSYESKQGIADTVAEKVGYEFYQDVDGDLVFKPPMYNLDTRSSRIYTIKREDVLDISFENQEPEYTYAVCKGSMFRNLGGMSMEGTWGVKGTYVDYRLVAKYGWKPLEFDTTFFNTARSAFFAAVVELEKKNVNTNGCTLSIPLRAELKPGYPVYIEHIDTFYYVSGISHSFSFGSDCTTSLTLTARRKKFLPPGDPRVDGIEGVRLDDSSFPQKSLIVKDKAGHYKTVGFPNVVMALDPTKPNPAYFAYGFDMIKGMRESLGSKERTMFRNLVVQYAYQLGILKLKAEPQGSTNLEKPSFLNGPWVLKTESGDKDLSLETKRVKIPNKSKATSKPKPSTKGKAESKPATDKSKTQAQPQAQPQAQQPQAQGKPSESKTQTKTDGKAQKQTKAPVRKARKTYKTYQLLNGEYDLYRLTQEFDKKRQSVSRLRKRGDQSVREEIKALEEEYEAAKSKLRGDGDEATIIDLIEAVEKSRDAGSALKPGNTASILTLLGDKKASFNPNHPGYYRYYSSSHPKPEHQAADSYAGDQKQRIKLEESRVDGVQNLQLITPTGKHSPNEVEIKVEGEVKRGFKTKTRYSNGFEIVPTKDIFFLSFQEHTVYVPRKRGWVAQDGKGIKGTTLANAVRGQVISHVVKLAKGKNLTVSDLKKKLYGRADSSKAVKRLPQKDIRKGSTTLADTVVVGDNIVGAVSANTGILISASYNNTYEFLKENKELDPKQVSEVVKDVQNTFGVLIKVGKKIKWVQTKGGLVRDAKRSWKSPIIPVSDEGGYEVFGSYQYGRGLDIIPQSSFDQLLKSDATRALSEDELDSVIDLFYKSRKSDLKGRGIKTDTDLGLTLAKTIRDRVGPKEFEELVTRLNLTVEGQGEARAQALLRGLGNALMTQQTDQVVGNVPTRLADLKRLTIRDESCSCRGDTSDVEIFLADSGNFLQVGESRDDIGDSYIVKQYQKEIDSKKKIWNERQQAFQGIKKVDGGDDQ
tara:strand:+ start:1957 stop:6042 length:4086 start_codon:yes stop_codon:yes gene_type:complete